MTTRARRPASRAAGRSGPTLLSSPQADPRVEAARQRALKSYVDGKVTFSEAEARVRRAQEKAAEESSAA